MKGPKVLLLDIETAPILGYVWRIWEQNVSLDQIKHDWYVLSWAAKWYKEPTIMYQDQRKAKNIEDDSKLLQGIWDLLDQADVVVTQNGKAFDEKKLNARFIINNMTPPTSYKHIDTRQIAKRRFGFTSNKLEYLADKLGAKYKKLKHKEFPGFELWKQCLGGNLRAWREMEKYNKQDVLALEEVYTKLQPWDKGFNAGLYSNDAPKVCDCGSHSFMKRGHAYTSTGKYQRYVCNSCGAWYRDKTNVITASKRKGLLVRV